MSRQIDWMLEQSPWLHQETTDSTVLLSSGEECTLLYNTAESTILDMLLLSIGDKRIVSIKVIAPFYDAEGDALSALKKQLAPKEMQCILDLERQSAPYSLLKTDTSTVFARRTHRILYMRKFLSCKQKMKRGCFVVARMLAIWHWEQAIMHSMTKYVFFFIVTHREII